VNVVMTAHRALVHDCFDTGRYAEDSGALEVATLIGGLVALVVGGLLVELALWAPFVLAAVGMLVLAWPTARRLPVADPGKSDRPQPWPLRFYGTAMIRPGVRACLAAEILWVIGYAALPVFFILYARRVLGLAPGLASLWLAAFALGAGEGHAQRQERFVAWVPDEACSDHGRTRMTPRRGWRTLRANARGRPASLYPQSVDPSLKPRLRGVSHQYRSIRGVTFGGGAWLQP
jgi:hypothetical protein